MAHIPLYAAGFLAVMSFSVQAQESALAPLLEEGGKLFTRHCKSCHGAEGAGFIGPALVGNDRLATGAFVVRQISKGGADMPPFGKRLSAQEIEAVASYVRNAWGNAYGPLAPEDAPQP